MLKNLFRRKPSINDPNASVRARAAAELPELGSADFERIVREDTDRHVRMNALHRADSLDLFVEFLDDKDLGRTCAEQISKRIQPEHELAKHPRIVPLRMASVESTEDKWAIVQALENPALIANAIVGEPDHAARRGMTDLVYDERLLSELEKASRGHDKNVNRQTRERLNDFKAVTAERDDVAMQIERVIGVATNTPVSDPHYETRRNASEREWELLLRKTEELNARLVAFKRAPFNLDEVRARFPERADTATLNQVDAAHFHSILVALRKAEDSEDAIVACEEDWLDALKQQPAPPETADEFYSLTNAKRRSIKEAERKKSSDQFIDQLVRPIEFKEPGNKVSHWNAAWKTQREANDRIKRIERHLERNADRDSLDDATQEKLAGAIDSMRKVVERTDELVNRLEAQINSNLAALEKYTDEGELKRAQSAERNVSTLINRLPPRRRHDHQAKTATAIAKLRQLKEWQRFAELPKREELCESIEELVVNPLEPEQQQAAIKALRSNWNALGMPNSAEERRLQARYDKAADEAFKVCEAWFEEINKQRELNLAGRVAICDSLSAFLENYDWEYADWRDVVKTLRAAQSEWRSLYPVSRSNSRKVGARFGKLTSEFQARIDAHWKENADRKRDVIEAAKAAYDDEQNDSNALIEIMKGLQAKWKTIGPAGKRDEQKLWNEFRAVCNVAFEQRQQEKTIRREKIDDDIKQAERLVADLRKNLSDPDLDPADVNRGMVKKVRAEFDDLALPKRVARKLDEQLHRIESDLDARHTELEYRQKSADLIKVLAVDMDLSQAEATEQQLDEAAYDDIGTARSWFSKRSSETGQKSIELHELVLRAEVLADIPSPSEDAGKRMQIQAARLQHGLTRGGDSDEQNVERLVEDWCSIAYGEQPLRKRFHDAITAHLS